MEKVVAQLIVGDSEEGISLYNFKESSTTNTLKLAGFDIDQKQVLFTDSFSGPNLTRMVGCLDYQGVFSIVDDMRDC